jgi:transposase-like protein
VLHYEAHRQLCHDRLQRRRDEAAAERLALQARRRHYRRRRLALAAGLGLLHGARRRAAGQRA